MARNVGLNKDGLPVAMQLIDRPRGEADLLAAAVRVVRFWRPTTRH
ncbi:hypothetical protein [Yoonia sediminilitoris]|nr:hypothetical protein [Yoonia sediminilitoris]